MDLELSAEGPFGAAGLVDAGTIGGGNVSGVIYVSLLTRSRLFVAKITFKAQANDALTIWLDPDPANEDDQHHSVRTTYVSSAGDLSFDGYRLAAGDDGATDGWDFDEVRFGTTFASVLPPPASGTLFIIR